MFRTVRELLWSLHTKKRRAFKDIAYTENGFAEEVHYQGS